MHPHKGIRPYGGPWLVYLTNNRIPAILSPAIIYLPAALAALIQHIENYLDSASAPLVAPGSESPFDFQFWHMMYMQWIAMKTVCLGVNVNSMISGSGAALGSNALLDVYPFHPRLRRMSKSITRCVQLTKKLMQFAVANAFVRSNSSVGVDLESSSAVPPHSRPKPSENHQSDSSGVHAVGEVPEDDTGPVAATGAPRLVAPVLEAS